VLRFSTKYEPALHSASGAKVSRHNLPTIGSGSTLKIMTAAESWEGKGKGVKLYLNAVQIIDMVEYGAADFENEEGGWEPEMAEGGFADESEDAGKGDETAAPDKKNYGF
jgi:hypothetical protein